jgi:hypothetical protein
VKLAYLIGRDTGHLLISLCHQILGLSDRPQSEFELDRVLECANRSMRQSSSMLGYLSSKFWADRTCAIQNVSRLIKCMYLLPSLHNIQVVYFRQRLRSLPVRNRHISLGNPVQNSCTRTAQNANIVISIDKSGETTLSASRQ